MSILGLPILQVERKNSSTFIHELPEYASLFLHQTVKNFSFTWAPIFPFIQCTQGVIIWLSQYGQVRHRKGTSLMVACALVELGQLNLQSSCLPVQGEFKTWKLMVRKK